MDDYAPIGPPWGNPHDRLDEIRRQCHIAIAAKIDAEPSLLKVPIDNLHRWERQAGYRPIGVNLLRFGPLLAEFRRPNERFWLRFDRVTLQNPNKLTLMGYRPPANDEWLKILESRSWQEIRHILVSPDENSTRLRQSTPFTRILTQRERYEIRAAVPA